MRRSGYFITLVLAVILSLCFSGTQSLADEKIYQMSGEISAIDLDLNTVVIEVPLGERLFTIGGPLSYDAVLKRGGQSVGLGDFRRGDQVTVKWEATARGHLIRSLKAG